jgi:hypothetical protein
LPGLHFISLICSDPPHPPPRTRVLHRYEDKEVQKDKKLVSYDITDKQGKPYVKVQVGKEDKVSWNLCTVLGFRVRV